MKIKFVLLPCLIGAFALASCGKTTSKTSTTDSKDTTSETVEDEKTNTFASGVTDAGAYDDGENWGELHS